MSTSLSRLFEFEMFGFIAHMRCVCLAFVVQYAVILLGFTMLVLTWIDDRDAEAVLIVAAAG